MKTLLTALGHIRTYTNFIPEIALVLGSGLGSFADRIQTEYSIDYKDIPAFPVSTIEGHSGKFIFGTLEGKKIVAMQGRVHYYEGYDMHDVVLPIHLMHLLGAKTLILTNAAGGVNLSFTPGDLMLITDHISSFVPSPLRGKNKAALGARFPDMSNVYDRALCDTIRSAAQNLNVALKEGVYLQFPGPAYETPAEIRMARTLGADAVGMSTAVEAMAAEHCGMQVCGISCITNMASGILEQPLSHEEVQSTASKVANTFTALMCEIIKDI